MTDDDDPVSQQSPWWYGLATRDWVLVGFLAVCALVAFVLFLLIVLVHE